MAISFCFYYINRIYRVTRKEVSRLEPNNHKIIQYLMLSMRIEFFVIITVRIFDT